MTVEAHATAHALSGDEASASAHLKNGVLQIGIGETALAIVTNGGDLVIGAYANASGPSTAHADADVEFGVAQVVVGLSNAAAATVSNGVSGNFKVHASANASGNEAYANATVGNATTIGFYEAGIMQDVFGAASANDGKGDEHLVRFASGSDYAHANAAADGIIEVVHAFNGSASAAINNSGSIDIVADASAVATGTAAANASVATGILEEANGRGGNASVSFANSTAATIDVTAAAKAHGGNVFGTSTSPGAAATVGFGVDQVASATGAHTTVVGTGATASTQTVGADALASFNNAGTIDVAASASADATILASAEGRVEAGVVQNVLASGNATAKLSNYLFNSPLPSLFGFGVADLPSVLFAF